MKKIFKKLGKKVHLRKLSHSNHGVVGIVVAVLLIGLLVSVVSILQGVYVPKWMEEKEAEHIEEVLVQFSQLKLAIDTHSINRENNTPIATSITLGSKELPFLMSTRAYGTLEIVKDACSISFHSGDYSFSKTYKLGIVRYRSHNAYFIPEEEQSFVFEAGAVITDQTSGNSTSVKPSFKPNSASNKIVFKIVNIMGVANKTSYGGFDTVPILTEYNFNGSEFDIILSNTTDNIKYIDIETSYTTAWETFLDSSLKKAGFFTGGTASPGYYEKIVIPGETVSITFYEPVTVELSKINIFAQIGPGWVE